MQLERCSASSRGIVCLTQCLDKESVSLLQPLPIFPQSIAAVQAARGRLEGRLRCEQLLKEVHRAVHRAAIAIAAGQVVRQFGDLFCIPFAQRQPILAWLLQPAIVGIGEQVITGERQRGFHRRHRLFGRLLREPLEQGVETLDVGVDHDGVERKPALFATEDIPRPAARLCVPNGDDPLRLGDGLGSASSP